MKYSADIEVGYYEDGDTYHGPFASSATVEAESLEDALSIASRLRTDAIARLAEPMPQGFIMRMHDENGTLVYEHAAGVVRPLLLAPEPESPAELIELAPRLTAQILAHLKRNPRELHLLRPRQFEELIAEFLAGFGWEVQLTPPTRDGGYDIFAVSKDISGVRTSWIVECKKYREDHKVGVGIVRALYGAASDLGKGNAAIMLATTSGFTQGARLFAAEKYNFELRDYMSLVEWINHYRPHPDGRLYLDGQQLRAAKD